MFCVIPLAEAGIQVFQGVLDPGFRRGDDPIDFLRVHQSWGLSINKFLKMKSQDII
jgi:hypothetical protein